MNMINVQKIFENTIGRERDHLKRVLKEIDSDADVKEALIKAVKRGEVENPENIRISIKVYEEKGAVERTAYVAFRFLLSELHPLVNVAMRLNFDSAIDALVPNKDAARRVKTVINNIKGKKDKVVIKDLESGKKAG